MTYAFNNLQKIAATLIGHPGRVLANRPSSASPYQRLYVRDISYEISDVRKFQALREYRLSSAEGKE